jgi:RNA-directed DNA polymerase
VSRRHLDTPGPLEPPVAQRDLELEVAKCVGGVASPLLANLFMHYAFDKWITREIPGVRFERYCDDGVPRTLMEVPV